VIAAKPEAPPAIYRARRANQRAGHFLSAMLRLRAMVEYQICDIREKFVLGLGSRVWVRRAATLAAAALLAIVASSNAEARRRPPPPPPPPPPAPVVVIPFRPVPPNGASPNFLPPMRGPDGLYPSVNRKISPSQTVWNFRSGYNVAALNCNRTDYPTLIDGYRAFLRTHSRGLTAANRAVDSEFRSRYGARFVAPREKYMTEVYNHFALPMTLNDFCKAVALFSSEAQTVPVAQLHDFAARSLPSIEIVFDDFYMRHEQWRIDAAAWDARYAPPPPIAPVVGPVTAPRLGPVTAPGNTPVTASVTGSVMGPVATPAIGPLGKP
jgi:hypothetical protein